MNAPLSTRVTALCQMPRAWKLVWTAAPGWTLAGLLLILVMGLLPLVSLFLLKQAVDALTLALGDPEQTTFLSVGLWIALLGLVALVSAWSSSVAGLVSEAQSLVVTDYVADLLHRKSVAVDLAYYEDPAFHDTLHLAQQEAPFRPARIVNGLTQTGRNLIILAGIIGLLLSFHWVVGVVLCLVALPSAAVRLASARQRHHYARVKSETERQAWYYHVLMTSLAFAQDIRLFGLGDLFVHRYSRLRTDLRRGHLDISRSRTRSEMLTQAIAALALYATLASMAYYAVQGNMTLGLVVMYFQGYQRAQGALQAVLQGLGHLYEDNLFLSHFYRFLDQDCELEQSGATDVVPVDDGSGLVCRGVTFSYPNQDRPTLTEVDLQIKPGEIVALVGANGAGKSTLAKLICRFYDPQQGTIQWQGRALTEMNPGVWRRTLSVVSQEVPCFDLSVAENIRLGDLNRKADDTSLMAAAGLAGARELIERLPHGLETTLGLSFGDGHELSAGERQRLVLARAFFRTGHKLLLLDEPSSALDPLAEAELIRTFRTLLGDRSALIISHRMATARLADTIYVLADGRIVEQGPHARLVEQNGLYARMYLAQAERYQS